MDLWDHEMGECAASAQPELQAALEAAGARGHPYNTPPRCLHLHGGGRVCLVHSPLGDLLTTGDVQAPGTLDVLLAAGLLALQDVVYVSFGRWHANNCEGVHPSYIDALTHFGSFVKVRCGCLQKGWHLQRHGVCGALNALFLKKSIVSACIACSCISFRFV
jgi:hypothetical protein